MITRREILQVGVAAAALTAGGSLSRAFAQQNLTEAELLKFDTLGNVTLLHVADIHGQLMPVYFREPTVNLGVGEARGPTAASHGQWISSSASALRKSRPRPMR